MKLWVNPPFAFALGAHRQNEPGRWEAALDALFGCQPFVLTLSLGWGWGPRVPLRPWPQAWWGRPVSGRRSQKPVGHSHGMAFCGIYFNFILSLPMW